MKKNQCIFKGKNNHCHLYHYKITKPNYCPALCEDYTKKDISDIHERLGDPSADFIEI